MNVNKLLIGGAAFIFSLFTSYGQDDVISNIVVVSVYAFASWTIPKIKQKYRHNKNWQKYNCEYLLIFFFFAISNIPNIYFQSGHLLTLYIALTSLCIGIIFLMACLVFHNALGTRFNKIPWTPDQKICGGVLLTILSLGFLWFDHDYFSFHKFATVLIILIALFISGGGASLIAAICMGLGASLLSLDLVFIATYALLALSAAAFKCKTKYMSLMALMVMDLVLGFYFRAYWGYGVFDILPVVLACLIVLILPQKLERYFDFSNTILGGHLVSKNTINRNRQGVYRQINNLGNVFNEMQNIYKNLVTGSATVEDKGKLIASGIVENLCGRCPNKANCRKTQDCAKDIDKAFQKICRVCLEKGNINFLDMPTDMSMKCTRLNDVLNLTNSYVGQIQKTDESRMKTDAGKIMMAGLLSGVSALCKSFSKEIGSNVVFDTEKATKIKDRLLDVGICASDCLITKNQSGEYTVSVLIPRADARNSGAALEHVIGCVAGHKMCIDTVDDADTAGFAIVTVKTSPRYSLTFGVAQAAKDFNPTNGDSFSFLRVTSDKTMMALCDGMGTGERARRVSVLAISLIENFYKAGFPNEVIMDSVNQLLILTEQEGFSAIDVVVFSLKDGGVRFIKVGGVEGFIKRARDVEVVESGSLPMGIVEEMIPKITSAHLMPRDMVVIVSDGVTDSFRDRVALANFINNIEHKHPQKIADEIIAECIRRTDKVAIDDCTVAIARLDNYVDNLVSQKHVGA